MSEPYSDFNIAALNARDSIHAGNKQNAQMYYNEASTLYNQLSNTYCHAAMSELKSIASQIYLMKD